MRKPRERLTYANVVATLALFLALGGGAAWAAGKITSKDIAAKAIKTRNLAPRSVTGSKVKARTLKQSSFRRDQLPGRAVLDTAVFANNSLSATNPPAPGHFGSDALPFGSSPPQSFVPAKLKGIPPKAKSNSTKSYLLEIEVSGTISDADGPGGGSCTPSVQALVNGKVVATATLVADADQPAKQNLSDAGATAPVGLLSPGQKQLVTEVVVPDAGCGATSLIDRFRVVVLELG